jgi:outer membrane protein
MRRGFQTYSFWCALAAARVLVAQASAPSSPLTIAQAVESAVRSYPTIRVSQEQINAAAAGIQLARTAYLPRLDALAQLNRATRNNVFGLMLPQSVIPSISGPVIGSNNFGTAWGSALGGLVTWEPFDFGLRRSNVAAADAARAQSQAALKRTEYDVAVAAADAYLTLAAAQQTVHAAQAGLDRTEALARTIRSLVNAELRPGADASRSDAEQAAARTELIQAQQTVDIARANVAQFVGGEPSQINITAPRLLELPPEKNTQVFDPTANPASAEQSAMVEQARAQLRSLERSYFPRFYLQGSAFARGTGAEISGARLGGLNGLAPTVQNYAVGFSVSFPIFDLPAIQAREAVQAATIRAQTAQQDRIAIELRAQWNRAVALLESARKIAANTPIQVSAAHAALQQATARYEAGLGNIDPVTEAQRLLTQAEIDDALAHLAVWRGLLGVAAAAGDLQPFLAEASQ